MSLNVYPVGRADPETLRTKTQSVVDAFNAVVGAVEGSPLPKSVVEPATFMADRYQVCITSINAGPAALDAAVAAAALVASCGSNIGHAFGRSPTLASAAMEERKQLSNVSGDLKEYCEAHSMELSPIKVPERGIIASAMVGQSPIETQQTFRTVADMQARTESTDRQMLAMEARLKALGESADNAAARVEEVVAGLASTARQSIDAEKAVIAERVNEVAGEVEETLAKIGDLHVQARALTGEVAISALAGGYANSAAEEKKSADQFRKISLWLMAFVALILATSLLQLAVERIHWPEALVRLAISIVLTLPIGYTAREAGRHRAHAVDLRKTSLDFAALTPYLETLPEPHKTQLKADVAQRVFFSGAKVDAPASYDLNPQELLMEALKVLKSRGG